MRTILLLATALTLGACASSGSPTVAVPASASISSTVFSAHIGGPPCLEMYAEKEKPRYSGALDLGSTAELCYGHFTVTYASATLNPAWSAEHLTAAMAKGADIIKRKDAFHVESALPAAERVPTNAFANSPYDRGHMTPADDMPDLDTQKQTFSMANMSPQASLLNERMWAALEGSLHVLAETDGELYVVTGPIFPAAPKHIKGVAIPTAFFKAVYDPAKKSVTVFYAENTDTAVCKVVSLKAVEQEAGVDPFPFLSGPAHSVVAVWQLPSGLHKPAPVCAS